MHNATATLLCATSGAFLSLRPRAARAHGAAAEWPKPEICTKTTG
ncbi:hypothetical protein [Pseudoroseicyclus sp. CXY001]